jgi:3-oxoadipyl-CoA thiolase
MQARDVVIVTAKRTAIGRLGGGLAPVRADDLLADVFTAAVAESGIEAAAIDEIYAGCANQAGEDNRNVARMATVLAGLPHSIPAVTVNRLCASGLEAVVQAGRQIALGEAEVCIAGGVENMSRAPYVMGKAAKAFPVGSPAVFDTCLGWRFPNPKMAEIFPLEAMGCTAENLVDDFSISRAEQDAFALASQQKALTAQAEGAFDAEIVPVEVAGRRGAISIVDRDEGPRKDTTEEKLASLRAVFRKGGSVTAGNSSTLNDGAAAVVLCSRAFADAHGLAVRATLRANGSAGVDPTRMGIGPVPATRKALQRAGMTVADLDLIELNEAFASQSIAVMRELKLDDDKVNVHGGAIALGHPLGCSGTRILTTLLHAMEQRDQGVGLATLCVGVGQGLALIIER